MDAGDQTPPRLSFVDGQVSFWRPGAQDWAQAQVNTPLAPGDQLSTGSPGNLELQIGARAFVRGWANTQLGLENQEPDFLQFKVTAGSAAFDLRDARARDTRWRWTRRTPPSPSSTPGYYRVDVTGERTAFITRRAGRATVIPASGEAVVIAPSEEVVIEGTASPQVASYAAPQLDDWDKWNYARTRCAPGRGERPLRLPRHVRRERSRPLWDLAGRARHTAPSGSRPRCQPGWAPYTTGSWTHDPSYGWTWVDTAPWGWAPYHYGRWVSVNGFWAWAPGPVVARPVYAPALVAFFGGPSVSVGISIGGPVVGWVALGWGEPLVPWWGRAGFIHRPSWGGWGGPRVVNNMVINNTTVVNVQNINVYRNSSVQNAVVVVNENRFGRGPITSARVTQVDVKSLQPIHTAPQVAATPASFVPTATRGIRPPEESLKRSVVATRPPHRRAGVGVRGRADGGAGGGPRAGAASRLGAARGANPRRSRPVRPSGRARSSAPRPIALGRPRLRNWVQRPARARRRPVESRGLRWRAQRRAHRRRPVESRGPRWRAQRRAHRRRPVEPGAPGGEPIAGRTRRAVRSGPEAASGESSAGRTRRRPVESGPGAPTPGAPPAGQGQKPPVASHAGRTSAPSGQGQKPPVVSPSPGAPPPSGRVQGPRVASPPAHSLPGESANSLAPHRAQSGPPQPEKPGG